MQQRVWSKHKRLFGALLASLLLHGLALIFLPGQLRTRANDRESVQVLTFSRTTKVNVERHSSAHHEVKPPHFKTAATTALRTPRKTLTQHHKTRALAWVKRPTPRRKETPPTMAQQRSPDAQPAQGVTSAPSLPVATFPPKLWTSRPLPVSSTRITPNGPPSMPASTSAPAAVALSEGRSRAAGVGIFGESREAILSNKDSLELKKLFRSASDVVIVVEVTEDGRAIRIRSIVGVDGALRDEVARRLMSAAYLPQICSGLPCAGQARILFNAGSKE